MRAPPPLPQAGKLPKMLSAWNLDFTTACPPGLALSPSLPGLPRRSHGPSTLPLRIACVTCCFLGKLSILKDKSARSRQAPPQTGPWHRAHISPLAGHPRAPLGGLPA